eukprot:2299410-Alexandrium_andersonii.AAC.1
MATSCPARGPTRPRRTRQTTRHPAVRILLALPGLRVHGRPALGGRRTGPAPPVPAVPTKIPGTRLLGRPVRTSWSGKWSR